MKSDRYKILILALGLIAGSNSCTSEKKEDHPEHIHALHSDTIKKNEHVYYCPMDPEVEQHKPGICPKCHMDLEIKDDSSSHEIKDYTLMPANAAVLSSVKSIKPERKSLPITIKSSGYITYDTRRLYDISARIEGRIEKLYVKFKYQPVSKGQALLDIYSHELLTAQNEYLYLKRNDPNANDLLNAAKKKLLLLGMTESQINAVGHTEHVHPTTTVYSPYSGFIVEQSSEKNSASSNYANTNGSMSDASNSVTMNQGKELLLKEGSYVSKGEPIFKVANIDRVWTIFEIYSDAVPYVKLNLPVHIMLENTDEMIMGKVDFIEPSYNEGAGTARIRVYLDNKNQNLKIGNIVSGSVDAGNKEALWIPFTSVVDLGKQKIAFVKKDGAFETRVIQTGAKLGNVIEVLNGLSDSEEVAENAQFLIDSESFVKVNQ